MVDHVIEVIQRRIRRPDLQLTAESDLLSELSLTSLDLVELVCDFELEFNIVVPEKDIRRFSKVGDIAAYLEKTI